jgi:hypothetical protein
MHLPKLEERKLPTVKIIGTCRHRLVSRNLTTCTVSAFLVKVRLMNAATAIVPDCHQESPALFRWKYTSSMEAYETKTTEIVKSFLRHKLEFPDCISALDAALAGFIPRLTTEHIVRLRIVVLANNDIVMKEMERRGAGGAYVIGHAI